MGMNVGAPPTQPLILGILATNKGRGRMGCNCVSVRAAAAAAAARQRFAQGYAEAQTP